MEIIPFPHWWDACGKVCGKIFSITPHDFGSILSVKFSEEEINDWFTVKYLRRSDGIFRNEHFTSYLEVKVIENKLYIVHQLEFEDGEEDPLWFIHILSISIKKGEFTCSWKPQFSTIKDPKGDSPYELDIRDLQVDEL